MGSWAEAELSSRFKVRHQHGQQPRLDWANWATSGSDTIAVHQSRLLTPRLRAPTASPSRHAGRQTTNSTQYLLPSAM